MRGIREAAMSQEEDEIIPKYEPESSWNKWPKNQLPLYEKNEFNPTAEEIIRDEKELESYTVIKPQGQIDITIGIKYTELKEDDYDVNWETKSKIEATQIAYDQLKKLCNKDYDVNWETKSKIEATQIAYDQLKKLCNKDFESKYQAIYTTEEDYDGINVMIKLTPIK